MRPIVAIAAIATAIAIGAAGGNGTAPVASLLPSTVAFGSRDTSAGPSAPQTVSVGNQGTATLAMSSVAITGADAGEFALSNPCGNAIGAGSTCPMNVTFDPTSTGAKTASLTVTDNAPGSPHSSTLTGTGTGATGNANLWVDLTGGTCTRQPTQGPYSDPAACGSFDAAFQAAQNGDSIRVKAGGYGDQIINNRAGSASPAVTLAPATGETVTAGSISLCGPDWLTITGPMTAHSISTFDCNASLTSNITLSNMTFDYGFDTCCTDGSIVGLYGNVLNFTMDHLDVKNGWGVKGIYISSWAGPNYPTNITLTYSTIHDWGQRRADDHTECLWMTEVHTLTLIGNHLWNCISTGDGIIGLAGEPDFNRDFYFANNIFEASWNGWSTSNPCPCDLHGVGIDGAVASLRGNNVFAYNLMETGFLSNGVPTGGATLTFIGNTGDGPACSFGTTFSYNRWINKTCGGTDVLDPTALSSGRYVGFPSRPATIDVTVAPYTTVSPVGNWHYINAAVPFVNAGNPNSNCTAGLLVGGGSSPCWPPLDADGTVRPINSIPDVGPYEKG